MKAHEAAIDFGYTKDLLDRINTCTYDGKPLINAFYCDGYNVWQLHQELLARDIKEFSKTKRPSEQRKPTLRIKIQEHLIYGILFIVSVLTWLYVLVRKPKILVYGVDTTRGVHRGDFRLDQLYRVLHGDNISYIEVVKGLCTWQSVTNLFIRRRPVFFIEVLDWLYVIGRHLGIIVPRIVFDERKLDLSSFSANEQPFVANLVADFIARSNAMVWAFTASDRLLQRTQVKAIYMLDDMRHAYPLLYAARKQCLPVVALQHGHFTKHHFGWLRGKGAVGPFLTPKELYVWSDFWKESLLMNNTYFEPEQIVVAGNKTPVPDVKHPKDDGVITIVVPYETIAPKHEVAAAVGKLVTCEGVYVLFKVRPDIPEGRQLAEYGLTESEHLEVITDHTQYLPDIDMVLGVYSTYLYDLLAYGKRAMILNTSSVYGRDMVERSVADLVDAETICEDVRQLAGKPYTEIRDRGQKVFYVPNNRLLSDTLRKSLENYHHATTS